MKAATRPAGPAADHTWRPGLLANRDLERYRRSSATASSSHYFGNDSTAWARRPPARTTIAETLNIMQDFSRRGVAYAGRTGTLYHYLEASRLAYADRNSYLGDPSSCATRSRAAVERLRRHARRADRPEGRPRARSPPARRPERPPAAAAASIERSARRRT